MAFLSVLKENKIDAKYATGLSLGEYAALIYSKILTFEDGIKLIQKRGYYMDTLLPKENYSMAAVIGLDSKEIEEVCTKISKEGKFVVPANYNCSIQTAISGEEVAIDEAIEKLKEIGAKKVVKLKTSGPFHTKKLEEAKKAYEKELENINFNKPEDIKVIRNLDGKIYNENDNMKEILAKHIISPVRFDKAIELMKKEQVDEYVEIGPRKSFNWFYKKRCKRS